MDIIYDSWPNSESSNRSFAEPRVSSSMGGLLRETNGQSGAVFQEWFVINRGVSSGRLWPPVVQGACTFVMARHLSARGRLIDQFLTACAAVFKGRIAGISGGTAKYEYISELIRRRGTRSKHDAFASRTFVTWLCVIPTIETRRDRNEKWYRVTVRGRCCKKEIVTVDPLSFESERRYHASYPTSASVDHFLLDYLFVFELWPEFFFFF